MTLSYTSYHLVLVSFYLWGFFMKVDSLPISHDVYPATFVSRHQTRSICSPDLNLSGCNSYSRRSIDQLVGPSKRDSIERRSTGGLGVELQFGLPFLSSIGASNLAGLFDHYIPRNLYLMRPWLPGSLYNRPGFGPDRLSGSLMTSAGPALGGTMIPYDNRIISGSPPVTTRQFDICTWDRTLPSCRYWNPYLSEENFSLS